MESFAALVPVECSGAGAAFTCSTCSFFKLVENVVDFIILVSSSIAVLIFMYAGFLYLTSGGSTEKAKKANGLFVQVVIGYILILGAFLIVDVIMRTLIDDSQVGILNWNKDIQCIAPTIPVEKGFSNDELSLEPGSAAGGSCIVSLDKGGPCSVANLQKAGFSAGAAANAHQICSTESGFNPTAKSSLDKTEDGRGYSVGLFQVNLSVHTLTCEGRTLDCKSAFEDTGKRTSKNVKIKRVIDEELFNACSVAAAKPECNIAKAKELQSRSGHFGDWACSAKKCGINTPKNNLCPL